MHRVIQQGIAISSRPAQTILTQERQAKPIRAKHDGHARAIKQDRIYCDNSTPDLIKRSSSGVRLLAVPIRRAYPFGYPTRDFNTSRTLTSRCNGIIRPHMEG